MTATVPIFTLSPTTGTPPPIVYTCSALPGAFISFNPTAPPSFFIHATTNTEVGPYPITVTGTAAGVSTSVVQSITITPLSLITSTVPGA